MTRYVDTSILAAYYCPEPLSEQAEQHLRRLRPPVISRLTDVELHSALAKKTRRRELSSNDAERVQNLFRTHVRRGLYKVVPIEQDEYVRARQWMATNETALRTLDALHLAAADRRNLPVLTADHGMADAGDEFGIEITLMEAEETSGEE
ncbi:type II toxin-antitoxin system VapC family toxin [Salinibacter sp.]|uniref:type II toxin-antitoxin system VapC family toxin n=1 Tax=Salinibacter sp. TaxID=2065818 RepID=UPI0021E780F8|nr:type II toxin-antitoxin system VapC family toxin [Salinibacter sp.]